MSIATAIGVELLEIFGRVLKRVLPDEELRDKISAEYAKALLESDAKLSEAKAKIIAAEAGSRYELAAIWRPVTMLTFVAIVANNYILAPYLQAIFGVSLVLEPPPQMWTLLHIGVGGYIASRGAEKVSATWKGGSGN